MSMIDLFRTKKLVIFDDVFPYLLSGFRVAEYNYYLENIKNVEICSTVDLFDKYKEEYTELYQGFESRIHALKAEDKIKGSLFYCIFINNIYNFLPIIEKYRLPFVFTLYPGGGFWINQEESDNKLKRVFASKYFRKVIATQKNTYEYLIEKKFCLKEKIEFIYGGVLPSDKYTDYFLKKKHYKKDKDMLDVCFVANKYIEKGLDKGYDIFIETAKQLAKRKIDVEFHVVGNWDSCDIDIAEISDRVTFYGSQYKDFLQEFYPKMDIILSPNRPYILNPGAFDGFPTGSCIEAGLAGVVVLCTDKLGLNVALEDGREICIIDEDVENIVNKVAHFYDNPDELYEMSKNCQESFFREFNLSRQMERRAEILKDLL